MNRTYDSVAKMQHYEYHLQDGHASSTCEYCRQKAVRDEFLAGAATPLPPQDEWDAAKAKYMESMEMLTTVFPLNLSNSVWIVSPRGVHEEP